MARILCVDDDQDVSAALVRMLPRLSHEPRTARDVPEALRALAAEPVDLIISDYQMPGVSGIEFLEVLAAKGYEIPLVMLTGHASVQHAVAAIKAGAADYLAKPFELESLELAITQALGVGRLRRENAALRGEVRELRGARQLIGESEAMRRLRQTIAAAAPARATVLIQGESGTGKELIARALHEQSDRAAGPFIQLNCAALPEGLIESALFGHERGAFTGALKRSLGAFERANGGTLLLDEISEMRLDLQAKLLRVLQEQEFERVGGAEPIRVDVRVIATTNRDLAAEVARGTFRQDLYYRLNVLPLIVPPLREREGDVAMLAQWFAARAAAEARKTFEGISREAIALLAAHRWPGNVRELQHTVERAVIFGTSPVLGPEQFDGLGAVPAPAGLTTTAPAAQNGNGTGHGDDAALVALHSLDLDDAERILIAKALETAGNNRTHAARLLGINVRTLRNKLNGRASARRHIAGA